MFWYSLEGATILSFAAETWKLVRIFCVMGDVGNTFPSLSGVLNPKGTLFNWDDVELVLIVLLFVTRRSLLFRVFFFLNVYTNQKKL